MLRKSVVLSISLSPGEEKTIKKLSLEEGKTRSQLVREALRQYQFNKTFARLQRQGKRIAIKLGIETDEDVERIAG